MRRFEWHLSIMSSGISRNGTKDVVRLADEQSSRCWIMVVGGVDVCIEIVSGFLWSVTSGV